VIIRIGVLILSMLIFGTVTWRLGLEPEERALMRRGRSSPPAKATTMSNVL
jgi:hypothetical protein